LAFTFTNLATGLFSKQDSEDVGHPIKSSLLGGRPPRPPRPPGLGWLCCSFDQAFVWSGHCNFTPAGPLDLSKHQIGFPGGSSPRPPFSRFARRAVVGCPKTTKKINYTAVMELSAHDSAPSEARKRGSGEDPPGSPIWCLEGVNDRKV
jgi:hypothetical protein